MSKLSKYLSMIFLSILGSYYMFFDSVKSLKTFGILAYVFVFIGLIKPLYISKLESKLLNKFDDSAYTLIKIIIVTYFIAYIMWSEHINSHYAQLIVLSLFSIIYAFKKSDKI